MNSIKYDKPTLPQIKQTVLLQSPYMHLLKTLRVSKHSMRQSSKCINHCVSEGKFNAIKTYPRHVQGRPFTRMSQRLFCRLHVDNCIFVVFVQLRTLPVSESSSRSVYSSHSLASRLRRSFVSLLRRYILQTYDIPPNLVRQLSEQTVPKILKPERLVFLAQLSRQLKIKYVK